MVGDPSAITVTARSQEKPMLLILQTGSAAGRCLCTVYVQKFTYSNNCYVSSLRRAVRFVFLIKADHNVITRVSQWHHYPFVATRVVRCLAANVTKRWMSGCACSLASVLNRSASTAFGARRCTVEWQKRQSIEP